MKIILKSDVPHLGRAGEILKVKPGYARNYLLPNNLALPARSGSAKEWKHKSKIAEIKTKKAQLLRTGLSKKLDGHTLKFTEEVTSKNRLFGSVSVHDIISTLKKEGFQVDKKSLRMEAPFKTTGDHKLSIDFGNKSIATITISILGKEKPSGEPIEDGTKEIEEIDEENLFSEEES